MLILTLASLNSRSYAASSTRIVLDRSTFPPISRPLLQETADQVAQEVDRLIPGDYPAGRNPKILCFVASDTWAEMPRAFVGKPRKIEPASARNYEMRVALTPNVLPGAWQRLVFQLAHELAHQKMDARVDNNALESFAVAVSLEVLHRLGYDPYREGNERYYAQTIPPEVMSALKHGDWSTIGLYLRYEWRNEEAGNWKRDTQFLAAMALRKSGNFPWERLLNVGATAQCGSRRWKGYAQLCPLSPASLEGFSSQVRALLGNNGKVAMVRVTATRMESGDLTFKEQGKWVSLRWRWKNDPVGADGFVAIE